ncbi:MAG TPA: DapH/DapD/GlmU-related protein [Candidatus Krumholzibacteria bacterium]|nr:DapH/DapD/GlmU-related protein [Candidatus Krumholzibacteria bacterium]HPD70826.1 DapH/DapD/GlmU-related protein [Candidatus Krumholzibacteria bacterium]HRY39474.1 DapH/DapD/GlmU-related protein [Candidatus Krumholzibacteria bacterium]
MPATSGVRTRDALRADLAWYFRPEWPWWRKLRSWFDQPEIGLLCLYRWGSWIQRKCPRVWRPLHSALWHPLFFLTSNFFDTHIMPRAVIGPGLYIAHRGGIWINPGASLGAYCHVSQGVVIGRAGTTAGRAAWPTIGDRVWIGPHAVITGGVRIGDGAVIGANSLVAAHVPENGVVVGVPAKLIACSGSAALIEVPGPGRGGASGE